MAAWTQAYIFSGSAAATWTLPPVAGNKGLVLYLDNRGTANVTVQRAGTDLISGYTTMTSMVMPPGTFRIIQNDGTYWNLLSVTDGIVVGEQLITLTSAYTLASQTPAQKMFNASASGALNVQPGLYFFECLYTLSAMSATSGSFGFAFSGTATRAELWRALANKAVLATAAAPQASVNTAANTALATATTATVGWAEIKGKVRITAAGTLIPQVSLGVAAAAQVGVDSHFRIWSPGLNTTTNIGNWS
jgi:hypothetical protein